MHPTTSFKIHEAKWADLKEETDKLTILNGDFNTSQKLTEVGRK